MADMTTTEQNVSQTINHISLSTTAARWGETEFSVERIEHMGGEVSYFVMMTDEDIVNASYTEEQMRALRDFLVRTLG